MSELLQRYKQILDILDKEQTLLKGVHERLFKSNNFSITSIKELDEFLNTPLGIDQFESFTSKFCRMQDSFVDKLVPLFLKMHSENISTAINNLHRMEQLAIVRKADEWVDMRLLRNKLVHEYIDDTEELLNLLKRASKMTDELFYSYQQLKAFPLPVIK